MLPSPPWQPIASWLDLAPPVPQMQPAALSTLSTIALVRTVSLAQFGVDPLAQGTVTALSRAIVTLNARLPALAVQAGLANTPGGGKAAQSGAVNMQAWSRLANVSAASAQVREAAASGLFSLSPAEAESYLAPAGLPLARWNALIDRVAALTPLIAASSQLGPDMTEPAQLADAIRRMRAVSVPALADPTTVASLTAMLDTVARLQASLGVDPSRLSYQAVCDLVADQAAEAASLVPPGAQPPRLARNPAVLAPAAVVDAAMTPGIAKLAALTWRVPPASSLPIVAHLLPVAALARAMPAHLAMQRRPCTQGCDASALMRQASLGGPDGNHGARDGVSASGSS